MICIFRAIHQSFSANCQHHRQLHRPGERGQQRQRREREPHHQPEVIDVGDGSRLAGHFGIEHGQACGHGQSANGHGARHVVERQASGQCGSGRQLHD